MLEGWVDVTEEYLEELYDTIKKQKGQLALALAILVESGHDIADLTTVFLL